MEPMRPTEPNYAAPRSGALRRSNSDRVIAGVVGGLAVRLGLDAKLLRIGWILLSLFGGGGVAVYLVAWFVVPDEAEQRSSMPAVLLLLFVAVPIGCALCVAAINAMAIAFSQGPNF